MYIWDITCKVRWNYQSDDEEGEEEDYVVSALCCSKAREKAKKIALKKSRAFLDEKEDGSTEKYYSLTVEDFINIERKDYIDG